MEHEALITLSGDIVAAHVSNNRVNVSDLPALIRSVYQALANVAAVAPVVTEAPKPAVSVRASVTPHTVTCLDCGFKGKLLKHHVFAAHKLMPSEYRARWNLPANHPLVAPAYADKRRQLALSIGLGRKAEENAVDKAGSHAFMLAAEAGADGLVMDVAGANN